MSANGGRPARSRRITRIRACGRPWLAAILAVVVAVGWSRASAADAEPAGSTRAKFAFRRGDRVAWVGSSSIRIGVWPRTAEFLLRTRHPSLGLSFRSFTTGGGTFETGLDRLDGWLDEFRPTVVFLNYGGNDADAGPGGLPRFRELMGRCVAKVEGRGARAVLVTPQAADPRKSSAAAAARRALYAEAMLAYGREHGWAVVDVHHPLDAMQKANAKDDPAYSILKDSIHLTDAAYVGWGFFLYDRLDPPFVRSAATVTASGRVTEAERCAILDVTTGAEALTFDRIDEVLPILPPGPLPPRLSVPLEAYSRYLLTVTGLAPGAYEISCEGRPIGIVDAETLAVGVNLNSLLLDGAREAPWAEQARGLWEGKALDQVGRTRLRFAVRRR